MLECKRLNWSQSLAISSQNVKGWCFSGNLVSGFFSVKYEDVKCSDAFHNQSRSPGKNEWVWHIKSVITGTSFHLITAKMERTAALDENSQCWRSDEDSLFEHVSRSAFRKTSELCGKFRRLEEENNSLNCCQWHDPIQNTRPFSLWSELWS